MPATNFIAMADLFFYVGEYFFVILTTKFFIIVQFQNQYNDDFAITLANDRSSMSDERPW